MLQCVAVCCSVLQCVTVCCSVLQCVAECCRECDERAPYLMCITFPPVCLWSMIGLFCTTFVKEPYKRDHILQKRPIILSTIPNVYHLLCMGWLRVLGSLNLYLSFAEYGLFCRALLQKRHMIYNFKETLN